MHEVLRYLELKNQYYEKFHSITQKFLDQTNQDKWDDLELVVDNRERILNIIHSFDHKIALHFQELNLSNDEMEQYRREVKRLMSIRGEWAEKIVTLDLELISKLDEVKSETIRELKKTVETSQQVGAFQGVPKRMIKPRKDA